jgi:hypothetical protein
VGLADGVPAEQVERLLGERVLDAALEGLALVDLAGRGGARSGPRLMSPKYFSTLPLRSANSTSPTNTITALLGL